MSLHELDLAQKVSDILVCVKDRTVDRTGPPGDIFSGGYIGELYGVTPALLEQARQNGITMEEFHLGL